jgi:hypothetical protein
VGKSRAAIRVADHLQVELRRCRRRRRIHRVADLHDPVDAALLQHRATSMPCTCSYRGGVQQWLLADQPLEDIENPYTCYAQYGDEACRPGKDD